MRLWETDENGAVTNGPGTMKKGDKVKIIWFDGTRDTTVLIVADPVVDKETGAVTFSVEEVIEVQP